MTRRPYRIDYLAFSYPSNANETTERLEQKWAEKLQAVARDTEGLVVEHKFGKRYDGRGNWRWVIHIPGEGADYLLGYLDNEDLSNMTRCDVRQEIATELTKSDLDALYRLATSRNTANRNINRRDARPRKKDEKRDGGGMLCSVGSLKSDSYWAVYQKPRERGACEYKLAGEKLGRFISDFKRTLDIALQNGDSFAIYFRTLAHVKQMEHTKNILGTTISEWALQRMDMRIAMLDERNEAKLEYAKVDIMGMSRGDQLSLLEYLHEVVNG